MITSAKELLFGRPGQEADLQEREASLALALVDNDWQKSLSLINRFDDSRRRQTKLLEKLLEQIEVNNLFLGKRVFELFGIIEFKPTTVFSDDENVLHLCDSSPVAAAFCRVSPPFSGESYCLHLRPVSNIDWQNCPPDLVKCNDCYDLSDQFLQIHQTPFQIMEVFFHKVRDLMSETIDFSDGIHFNKANDLWLDALAQVGVQSAERDLVLDRIYGAGRLEEISQETIEANYFNPKVWQQGIKQALLTGNPDDASSRGEIDYCLDQTLSNLGLPPIDTGPF